MQTQRTCKINGCNKKHWALGLCNMHYHRQRRHDDPLIVFKRGSPIINVGRCIIPGCVKNQCIKHMCRTHYWAWKKWGDPRLLRKVGWFQKGSQNPNWRGGVAEYKNHSLMKKLRLQKLKQVNYKCEHCGKDANFIYHKNGDRQDQRIENYLAFCKKCFNHYPKMNTKYIRLYGKKSIDLAKYYDIRPATLWNYLTGKTKHPSFLKRANMKGKDIIPILRKG